MATRNKILVCKSQCLKTYLYIKKTVELRNTKAVKPDPQLLYTCLYANRTNFNKERNLS